MTTTITGIAGEDLSSSRYLLIKVDATAETFKLATSATSAENLGILQNQPASGKLAEVVVHGLTKAVAGAAIEPYDFVMFGTGAKVVKYVTGATNVCIGRYMPRVIDTAGTLSYKDAAATDEIDIFINVRAVA